MHRAESYLRLWVQRVAGVVAGSIMLFAAGVVSEFTVGSTPDESFGELLAESSMLRSRPLY